MKLTMKQTIMGSPDGNEVREYMAGEVYDVPESLAGVFLAEDWAAESALAPDPQPEPESADEAEPEKPKRGRRSKSKGAAPENK